ncbi:MAG: signal recognition particle protein [Lactobacillales bacterium]|jgi:signal recognition particle subunit SRP54|nr:signal recognition particle protein [Lactobacillales bacterium]
MFTSLADKLSGIFDKLTRRGILNESMVDEAMREIKIALLEADVALPVVKTFIANAKEKAIGAQVVKSIQPGQMVVKIVHDELVSLLGTSVPLNMIPHQQNVILMVGLQGSGKTTSSAKLALRLKKEGKKVLLASLDTYRPAAQEQLQEMAQANQLDFLPIVQGEKPLAITRRALNEGKLGLYDILILDTAGRLHIDDGMMKEVADIRDVSNPKETLLVVDSMMGQDAVRVATEFKDKIGITGVILTRVDGDARGGAALSLRSITGVPLQFLGVGEKADAFEVFDAKRIADRILGMGDIVGLVETTIDKIDKEEAQKTTERFLSGQFNLNDLLDQMRQINKMGDIKGIMKMIPGLSKMRDKIDQSEISNNLIKRQEAIILSMTPQERRQPDILKAARKQRIAAGAGVSVSDVNRLLKQYEQMADMMKKVKKMGPLGMMSMMKKMKGMMGNQAGSMMDDGMLPPFMK